MTDFPAFPDIVDMLVGRYGFAVKLCPQARPFARGEWYLLRPGCRFISGPFGTRDHVLRLLDKANSNKEKEWGTDAARVWIERTKP